MSWTFFQHFMNNWQVAGAISPSSPELARLMVDAAGVSDAEAVLELGVGTGAITQRIAETLRPGASFLGLDLNEGFVHDLQERYQHMSFQAVAAQECDFASFFADTGSVRQRFDCIVSGLPWTAFPQSLQGAILDRVLPWLKTGGRFVTFAYAGLHLLPSGQRFKHLLASRCDYLQTTQTVCANLPPAFAYVAWMGEERVR